MAFENTEKLNLMFEGKKLTGIKFYNVNDNYFVFNETKLAIIDGGVEFDFEDEKLVLAWNAELELFDNNTESAESLLAHLDYYQIDSNDLPLGIDLLGHKVESIETKWNWYQKLNDELEPYGSNQYVTKEIVITFQSKRILQVATITYEIENKSIKEPKYDYQGNILLSVDNVIEITDNLDDEYN